jgi:hypothetical protein
MLVTKTSCLVYLNRYLCVIERVACWEFFKKMFLARPWGPISVFTSENIVVVHNMIFENREIGLKRMADTS